MASPALPVEVEGTSPGTQRHIPLLCCVCPETPRFSDVSHLLTHIASKGHLHHETQTKLRAHQDPGSGRALQEYDEWYRVNGIEALLVNRLKAKQSKEAARNKRARVSSAAAPSKVRHISVFPNPIVNSSLSNTIDSSQGRSLDELRAITMLSSRNKIISPQPFPSFLGFSRPTTIPRLWMTCLSQMT